MSTAPLKSYGLSLVGCAIAATLLVTASYAYLRFGAYLDHIEGGVVVSGWEYAASGTPLYQLQDGVPRFATYYGPLAYLVEDLAPLLFQPSIAVSKLASLLALFATIAIMAAHFLVRRQSQGAWGGLFYLLAGCLFFVPVSFWVRPDPFETLLVAAGVALAANPIALGLCIGLAVNFKIHAFIYFFPILVESLAARRWQSLAIVAASAMVAFALPFLAPGLSLHDYLAGLLSQIGGRHPSRADLAAILVPALLLGLPMAYPLVTQKRGEPDRVYALAALAALGLLFYPAAFPGAGPYHFLPLVPVLADALSRLKPPAWIAALSTIPLLLLGLLAVQTVRHTMAERDSWAVIAADALALARQAPTSSVQIGYGDSRQSYDIAELGRAELTLHGYPAQIDAQILMELGPIGIDGSRRWVDSLARCGTERWLLPKGETPFALTNFLYGLGPIFDADFRREFLAHYRLTASDQSFDVWDCAGPGKTLSSAN